MKIACPKCKWEPDGGAYWVCDSCGTTWDTFSTAARCPGCKKQFELTSCIPFRGGCDIASPHLEWYLDLDQLLKDELEKIRERTLTPTIQSMS